MPSSGDTASRKCFSGIVSRLLCSGSLPTHPSEQLIESSIEQFGYQKPEKPLKPEENTKQVAAAAATPGVVARLMGLDSFPTTTPKDRTLGDFFRSKSVNSIDFLSHFDPIKHGHHQHRRVKTSVSFREGINDDVASIILRLNEVNETRENNDEDEDEAEEMVIRTRPNVKYQHHQGRKLKERRRPKNREIFQERKCPNRPGKNLEIDEQRKSVPRKLSPGPRLGDSASKKRDFQGKTRVNLKEKRPLIMAMNSKEEFIGSKCVKKKTNKILSHNVHCLKKIHPDEGILPEVAVGVCSRKQLTSQTANSEIPYSDNDEVRAIFTGKNERKIKIKESCYYKRMVEDICMLTENDVRENWVRGMVIKFEDFEEICQEFGQEILEALLKQFVDELVLLFGEKEQVGTF